MITAELEALLNIYAPRVWGLRAQEGWGEVEGFFRALKVQLMRLFLNEVFLIVRLGNHWGTFVWET